MRPRGERQVGRSNKRAAAAKAVEEADEQKDQVLVQSLYVGYCYRYRVVPGHRNHFF